MPGLYPNLSDRGLVLCSHGHFTFSHISLLREFLISVKTNLSRQDDSGKALAAEPEDLSLSSGTPVEGEIRLLQAALRPPHTLWHTCVSSPLINNIIKKLKPTWTASKEQQPELSSDTHLHENTRARAWPPTQRLLYRAGTGNGL